MLIKKNNISPYFPQLVAVIRERSSEKKQPFKNWKNRAPCFFNFWDIVFIRNSDPSKTERLGLFFQHPLFVKVEVTYKYEDLGNPSLTSVPLNLLSKVGVISVLVSNDKLPKLFKWLFSHKIGPALFIYFIGLKGSFQRKLTKSLITIL